MKIYLAGTRHLPKGENFRNRLLSYYYVAETGNNSSTDTSYGGGKEFRLITKARRKRNAS